MIIITLMMIIIIKTTTIVISYYLKKNTNNEAKLHVIYVNGNLYKFIFLVQDNTFTAPFFQWATTWKKISKSVKVIFKTNF